MADSVKIKIVGDDSQYRSTLGSLAGTTKSVLSSTGSIIKGMLGAQVITRLLSMLTNGFRGAMSAGMSFEASMSNVAVA